jgi:hypothetical protein
MKALIVAAAVLASVSVANAADFSGKWVPNGAENQCAESPYGPSDLGDALVFSNTGVQGDEWGADIKKVVRSGSTYTLSLYQPYSDMNGAAQHLTWHISLSKDGKTAKIDGKTYERCR